jgi:UDP-N-acetyl-D-galactosamine dehydrogenase
MDRKIGVIGLGYVGLPLAVAFSKVYPVIGFDINFKRIESLKQGFDSTGEVNTEELCSAKIDYTSDESRLEACNFLIVTVPTPVDHTNRPDLISLIKASETVGRNIKRGTAVVYESTVYPGATEEVCVPVIEQISGLKSGKDFFVGYSPERINPGDKEHTFKNIKKVVSGQNETALSVIVDVYGSVVEAGVFRASSIKVAEASKVIENTQRDLNIALMNELTIIFNKLGIDTNEVLEAASTKWNFLPFKPGLVGGHCIGVDPYYLTYKAESIGYHPEVILAGRRINDKMGQYVATSLIKQMILRGITITGSTVTIAGITFKENIPDIRNSKVIDIVHELQEFGVRVQVIDPLADPLEVEEAYGIKILREEELVPADAIILTVSHRVYVNRGWELATFLLRNKQGVVADIKGMLDRYCIPEGVYLWRL